MSRQVDKSRITLHAPHSYEGVVPPNSYEGVVPPNSYEGVVPPNFTAGPDLLGFHASRLRSKQRLDTLLVERGLAESRERAKQLILAGEVLVESKSQAKPGHLIPINARIEVQQPLRYVSRGGLKLEKALQVFQVDVRGKVAIDVGASTGGFTDCLLQHGAKFVYAVDVGYGQLAWRIRQDPRVCAIEQTNIRTIDVSRFDQPIEIGVVDVSFIALQKVLPVVTQIVQPAGDVIALVKPQFEAGREQVSKGGVVRDPRIHVQVLCDLIQFVQGLSCSIMGVSYSPIRGPAGNIEYLLWVKGSLEVPPTDWGAYVSQVVQQAHEEFRTISAICPPARNVSFEVK